METSPCCKCVAGHQIAINICTCHDSTAVVSCTKFCSDPCSKIEERVERKFPSNLNCDGKTDSETGPWSASLLVTYIYTGSMPPHIHQISDSYLKAIRNSLRQGVRRWSPMGDKCFNKTGSLLRWRIPVFRKIWKRQYICSCNFYLQAKVSGSKFSNHILWIGVYILVIEIVL